ncbi:MAG: SGNH/GDSL hydrolase family protein [Opitutales bacterium]|nr:SGNH/GDSL hydrolase family protein [Opitutales bacterium]
MSDSPSPITLHCLGDSITEAAGLPECGRWTALLQRLLDEAEPGAYAVHNHGIGGNTSTMGMERMRHETIGQGITIIQFGLNDCACQGFNVKNRVGLAEYLDNLRAMVAIVRRRGGQPVLVANHLPVYENEIRQSDGHLYSDKVRAYNAAVRDLAAELDVPLIDMEAHFADSAQAGSDLRADGLHLNIAGNEVYARRIFAFLQSAESPLLLAESVASD